MIRNSIRSFVVRVSFPFYDIEVNDMPSDISEWRNAIAFASKQKIIPLFIKGCIEKNLRLPNEAKTLLKQCYMRYKIRWGAKLLVLKELVELSETKGIDMLVFKTLKPFPYDPDDIDILVKRRYLGYLIDLLRRKKFVLLKRGTPEITMRKLYSNTYVDLDIHTDLAVGYVRIFKGDVFKYGVTYKPMEINGNIVTIPVLADELEILREATYILLKDMIINASSLYLGTYALLKMNVEELMELAKGLGLRTFLSVYLLIVLKTSTLIFGTKFFYKTRSNMDTLIKLMEESNILKALISTIRPQTLPYALNPIIIAYSYTHKMLQDVKYYKELSTLIRVLKQPGSKGVGQLIDYMKKLLLK